MFSSKLYQLRREKGLSQEQLSAMLNVSRQAVSKWEAGGSMPELEKLIALSDIFGVSVDYLVRDNTLEREQQKTVVTTADNVNVMEQLGEIKQYIKRQGRYEYKSRLTLFGLPLVHVAFSNHCGFYGKACVAKGIIAIGNIAVGVVSIGGIAAGAVSFGGLALGLLLALGGLAVGGVAFGGAAIGLLSLGGIALGRFAIGGMAVASELAAGGAATGRVAVGQTASGEYVLKTGAATAEQIRQFIYRHYPNMWDVLARFISMIGSN